MVHLPKGQRQNNTEGIASATPHCDGKGGSAVIWPIPFASSLPVVTTLPYSSLANDVGFSERQVPTVKARPLGHIST